MRYHTGYLGVGMAASMQLGIPRPLQTLFLIEDAMANLMPESEARVRSLLVKLDAMEEKLFESADRLVATQLEDLHLRDGEPDLLEREYKRWAQRLADILGVPLYPFSTRFMGNSVNVPVRG